MKITELNDKPIGLCQLGARGSLKFPAYRRQTTERLTVQEENCACKETSDVP
jgi:hypothetical protein